MNLHIVAVLKFKENHLLEAIEILRRLVNETRKEEGCLQYDLIEDHIRKGTFFIIEKWETDEHHFKHSESEHLKKFREEISDIVEERTTVYKGYKSY